MCGIVGFSQSTELTRAMQPIILMHMAARGGDSWGVTDGVFVAKEVGSILDTYIEYRLEAPTFHTRGASVGAISINNTHPFQVDCAATGKTVIGVHNGHINNYAELRKKYNRSGEVDSYQIFAQLAENKPLDEIDGWGTVVWYEYPIGKPEKLKRYISRFKSENLAVARLKSKDHEVIFASTKSSIETAALLCDIEIEYFYDTKMNFKYELDIDCLRVWEELPWGKAPLKPAVIPRIQTVTTWSGTKYQSSGRYYKPNEICAIPKCYYEVTKNEFICPRCVEKLTNDYLGKCTVVVA